MNHLAKDLQENLAGEGEGEQGEGGDRNADLEMFEMWRGREGSTATKLDKRQGN